MRFRWWQAALLAGMLAAGILIGAPGAGGQAPPKEPPPPPPERIVDADGDKVFDDLEESLAPAAASQPFDVIVLLSQTLSTANFDALRQQVGPFGTRFEYPSINGFAARLTGGQIKGLARLPVVRQVEADRQVTAALDQATFWFGIQKARNDFGLDGNSDGQPTYSDADVIAMLRRQQDLNFEPGTKFMYSNSGYFLLAVVVQTVAKVRLSQFAKERIFEPLGMADTLIVIYTRTNAGGDIVFSATHTARLTAGSRPESRASCT